MRIFNQIHKNYKELEVAEIVEEDTKSLNEILNIYLKENNISLNELLNQKSLLLDLIWIMKSGTRKSNSQIAKVLGINKNKMTRLFRQIMKK